MSLFTYSLLWSLKSFLTWHHWDRHYAPALFTFENEISDKLLISIMQWNTSTDISFILKKELDFCLVIFLIIDIEILLSLLFATTISKIKSRLLKIIVLLQCLFSLRIIKISNIKGIWLNKLQYGMKCYAVIKKML